MRDLAILILGVVAIALIVSLVEDFKNAPINGTSGRVSIRK